MKTAVLVTSPFYHNNRIFDLNDPVANRDNVSYPFHLLKQEFKKRGWNLVTADLFLKSKADAILYMEMPKTLPSKAEAKKSYIWLAESELIIPANWNLQSHKSFAKIFTWHDGFVDGKRYIKLNFAQKFMAQVPTSLKAKTNFCTLIAGNKMVSHPLELYSHRVNAIRWFEKHSPSGFHFYGMGWNQRFFTGLLRPLNKLNRFVIFKKLTAPRYPSYRGPVKFKLPTLATYRFAICYENGHSIPGYITEKIFDCLQAGCIPIYWGAPNIRTYVPKNCFIDLRDFMKSKNEPDYAALNKFLRQMSDKTYQSYLKNIKDYIGKKALRGPWSAEFFAKTLATTITGKR